MKIRSGIGVDVHAFARGRPLVLGGVRIDHEFGLAGHSDADVLVHAIVDAIVGPVLGTDIGGLFPDTDDAYANIDSCVLLERAMQRVAAAGYRLEHVDAVIIAQAPKLGPHIPAMRRRLAAVLAVEQADVTIKATTTEHLGFTGRKEGITAVASALVAQPSP